MAAKKTPAKPAPVAVTPAPVPAPLTSWTLPAKVQEEYRLRDEGVREALLQLGGLEAEYAANKNAVLAEVEKRAKARMDVLTSAAKDAGIDVDNEKWTLDTKSMVLSKT